MIFETDFRQPSLASVATSYFSASAARVFNILNDPSSWGQIRTPRVSSATLPSKIVLSFDGIERATVSISSWNTDFSQMEVVLDGFPDDSAKAELESYWLGIWKVLDGRLGTRSS